MINWIKRRSKEPTTFIGLALLIQAVGVLTKAHGVPEVATQLSQAAEPLAAGDYASAATIGLGALMGILMKEKADR